MVRTQRGQLLRVRSHFDMQSRWKTWPQLPHAILRPSSDADVGLAWYSILGSCKLLRHIAQVSVHMDQDQTATADHYRRKWDEGAEKYTVLTFFSWNVESSSFCILVLAVLFLCVLPILKCARLVRSGPFWSKFFQASSEVQVDSRFVVLLFSLSLYCRSRFFSSK